MKKRAHIIYSGRVQGVGFRWTAERVAISLGITGLVRNLENGDVEVIAEGKETDINDFLAKIKEQMQNYIRDILITWSDYKGDFDYFYIKHS